MSEDAKMTEKRREINLLFDAVAHEKGVREWEVFRRYYEEQAQKTLSQFLKDIATCPPEIVAYCQHLLAPQAETPP